MADQIVGDIKTNLDAICALVPNMTLRDRKYLLEKLMNRKVTDDECGTVGSRVITDGLSKRKTRAEYLKDWGHLRKFEEPGTMSFTAWRRNMEPLLLDASVPNDVKSDIILAALGPKVYSKAVMRQQDQSTPEQLIIDLEADYKDAVDETTELVNFLGLRQREEEDVLQFAQRVRICAEVLKDLKKNSDPNFDALQSTLTQIHRGCSTRDFVYELKITPPTTFPKLIAAAKHFIQEGDWCGECTN